MRGTLTNVQRRSLAMEIYNPYSIVQVSEVLIDLAVRSGDRVIYAGKAIVSSLLNTGLMAVVSVTLTEEWCEFNAAGATPASARELATAFVQDWTDRFKIDKEYQAVVGEFRAFLSETSRWVDQTDLATSLPRDNLGRIREDVFEELALPLFSKGNDYFLRLEEQGGRVRPEALVMHRAFAQSALHPLILRAPFVYRAFAKPLGYAGDSEMVNQILADPRQGPSTYFHIVNAFFLKAAVAQAHRNRIGILTGKLVALAHQALQQGRTLRVLNVGCGPAIEIQRFVEQVEQPQCLEFTLMDFSEFTLESTGKALTATCEAAGKRMHIKYVHESVHQLLKRASRNDDAVGQESFDMVYCAGLFDYLSDKVCMRLLEFFRSRTVAGGSILVTNVHARNPQRHVMEHLLEWHLIYRDEAQIERLLPPQCGDQRVYCDETGVNVFAECTAH